MLARQGIRNATDWTRELSEHEALPAVDASRMKLKQISWVFSELSKDLGSELKWRGLRELAKDLLRKADEDDGKTHDVEG